MSGATFRSLSLFEKEHMPVRVTTVLSSVNVRRLRDLVLLCPDSAIYGELDLILW
jgi:hypothetical protein